MCRKSQPGSARFEDIFFLFPTEATNQLYIVEGENALNNSGELMDDQPELIDMVGARFEAVAQMGAGDADTVLFRTRMPAGKIVPLHSHIDPECFYVLSGQIQVGLDGATPVGTEWKRVTVCLSLMTSST